MTENQKDLLAFAMGHVPLDGEQDILKADCDVAVYLLEHCEITVPAVNRFGVRVDCETVRDELLKKRAQAARAILRDPADENATAAKLYSGSYDYGHTSACWEDVIQLGVFGLKQRLETFEKSAGSDPRKQRFFRECLRVYNAALDFTARAALAAEEAGKSEMAEGLFHLTRSAPANLFEALQTVILYYTLQQFFDGTRLRTLGRLDSLLFPFYEKADKTAVPALLLDFLREIDLLRAPANMPFALAGSNEAGQDLTNDLSFLLLDAYRKAGTHRTKLHLLLNQNTPRALVEQGLLAVREGNNSIVFMNDPLVIRSLVRLGEDERDAVNYHVVGCYECGGAGEVTCSCAARVNLPKALEMALTGGRDLLTGKVLGLENDGIFPHFEDLFREYLRQVEFACRRAMACTDLCEENDGLLHAAPVLSATYRSALERGGDLYCDHSAKYANSSVNALGLGTATDSLAAIRKLVYEDQMMTLQDLTGLLQNDWAGRETLRLTVKNKYPKYGMGDISVDDLAKRTVSALDSYVNGKPNKKGGVYRLGLFSIDWRWKFGEMTGASADGRHARETISQNTGASFGADRNGPTAHLTSVARLDGERTPNGAIVDLDLHASAVQGENGLRAMTATLLAFFAQGGFCVHYNVLDAETLKKAKADPTLYPNLQVRLCGWNVLFSSLSEKEKDEFIARAEDAGRSA